jgi:hypothetical protein
MARGRERPWSLALRTLPGRARVARGLGASPDGFRATDTDVPRGAKAKREAQRTNHRRSLRICLTRALSQHTMLKMSKMYGISLLFSTCVVGCNNGQQPPPQSIPPQHVDERPNRNTPEPEISKPINKNESKDKEEKSEKIDPDFSVAAKPMSSEDIEGLIKLLPLSLDGIFFHAIDKFCVAYAPFTKNRAILQTIRNQMKAVVKLQKDDIDMVALSASANEVLARMKRPLDAYVYIVIIKEVLSTLKLVILEMASKNRELISKNDELKIYSQIGGSYGNSIYSENQEFLSRLETNILAIVERKKGR